MPGSFVPTRVPSLRPYPRRAHTSQVQGHRRVCLQIRVFLFPRRGPRAQTPCAPGTTSGPGATVCTAVTATATNTPTPTPEAVVSGTVDYGNAIDRPKCARRAKCPRQCGRFAAAFGYDTASGTYSLTGFGTGSYTITPSKSGGQNGSITSFDAGRIAQYLTGNTSFTTAQATVADVSGASGISSFDAALIARYAAALGSPTGIERFVDIQPRKQHASVDHHGYYR